MLKYVTLHFTYLVVGDCFKKNLKNFFVFFWKFSFISFKFKAITINLKRHGDIQGLDLIQTILLFLEMRKK